MTGRLHRWGTTLVVLLAVTAAAACGSTSPLAPQTSSTSPAVTAIAPTAPRAAAGPQTLMVTGNGFSSVSLVLDSPDGGSTTYPHGTIAEETATSFKASVTLSIAGAWRLTVRNADGVASTPITLSVASAEASTPQILAVTPDVIVNSSVAQTIAVAGVNFRAGVSLIVRNALGETATYNGASLTAVTATSFSAQILMTVAGAYQLSVRNADGTESSPFTLVVSATPVVTMVTGALSASLQPQLFDVYGLHFQPGLSFVLKGPDTGAVRYGSVNVTALETSHFRATATLPVQGDWTITVINANGVASAEFAFHVG